MREILGAALAVILSLFGVFIVYEVYAGVTKNTNVQDDTNKMITVRNELSKAYGNQPGRYGTAVIAPATLIGLGAVTDDMVISNTQLANPWGGAFIVTGNGQSLALDQDNIPETDCNTLVTNQRSGSGVVSFAVGTTIASASSASAQTVPVSPANTGCVAGVNAVRTVLQ